MKLKVPENFIFCISINDILISNMDKMSQLIEIPLISDTTSAFTLEGTFDDYSTEDLHHHSCHQILKISTGITLLVEEHLKQPLFSNMTAFIPAGLSHRSTALGENIRYKSIYIGKSLFDKDIKDIVIFDMSNLGVALFDKITGCMTINDKNSDAEDLNTQCLNLLLKLMETEIDQRSHLTRIPIPKRSDNLKIAQYIADNFDNKLKLSDFTDVLHYSERHLSRIFKKDLNITIFEYLKLYRIFQSSLMLCNNEKQKTVTEIALASGYDSLSSFYKDFKDIFSMTPKAFNERNGLGA